jgi:hypothetical protein
MIHRIREWWRNRTGHPGTQRAQARAAIARSDQLLCQLREQQPEVNELQAFLRTDRGRNGYQDLLWGGRR